MTWGQGSTRASRAVRDAVLERDNHLCQLRYNGCTTCATIADHKVTIASRGLRRRDAINPDDYQAACPWCHDIKTKRETAAVVSAANTRRLTRRRLPVAPHPGG